MRVSTPVIERKTLRQWLEEREMSQAAFARRLGVTRQMVHELLSGEHSPTVRTLDKMCEILGVRRDDIELGPPDGE